MQVTFLTVVFLSVSAPNRLRIPCPPHNSELESRLPHSQASSESQQHLLPVQTSPFSLHTGDSTELAGGSSMHIIHNGLSLSH